MPTAFYGNFDYGELYYGQIASATLASVRLSGRKSIDISFDKPVKICSKDLIPRAPENQLVPVDWIAKGGTTEDAANPDNYAIIRPSGGYLDGGGEAIDVVVTWANGVDGYTSEAVESGTTYVYSTVVRAYFDFQTTPRADYRITLSNLVAQTGGDPIIAPNNTKDFTGLVISHVPRSSLRLYDILPKTARELDDDGTGDLAKFCTALQEVFDRMTEDIDAFFDELCTIEYIREEFIDAMLYDLGDQFSEKLSLTTIEKRRLARSLVGMYKLKGTCVGITNAIEFFLGITMSGCRNGWWDTGYLYKGTYPSPVGGDFDLYKGTYPSATGGSGLLGPNSYQSHILWLLHPTPGSLTADELSKISIIVDLMKPAEAHYSGVIAP